MAMLWAMLKKLTIVFLVEGAFSLRKQQPINQPKAKAIASCNPTTQEGSCTGLKSVISILGV